MKRIKVHEELHVLEAISGCEDPSSLGIQIEDNYLKRERMENRREQGFWVSNKWLPEIRSTQEKEDYRHIKMLEDLVSEGSDVPQQEYEGKPYPEDRFPNPKNKTVEII